MDKEKFFDSKIQDSPPPNIKIRAGHYRRPSFPTGLLGYCPYEPPPKMPLSYYGSTPQDKIIAGSCPACQVGRLESEYSYLTLCCFCFMPFAFGRHKKCSNCGAYIR